MLKVAIAYDFDGTLAKGNIQENSFIPSVGITKEEFWSQVKQLSEEQNMDEILSYMYLMIKIAEKENKKIDRDNLKNHGKSVKYFNGVEEYFNRINEYAKSFDIEIKHYIISSGTKEMIEGTTIANEFDIIYASSFFYDDYGKPVWPALAINYTTKTQYLYRINKGIHNAYDNKLINKYIPENEREIQFKHIIYLGDGETDIPAMKLVKANGGKSIAVFDKEKRDLAKTLIEQNRVNYVAEADYVENSDIDIILKSIIYSIYTENKYGSVNRDNIDIECSNEQFSVKKCLSVLDIKGFATAEKNRQNNMYLKKSLWNDHEYQTTFYLWKDEIFYGMVKIAKFNQSVKIHTLDLFPNDFFQELPENFFSKIYFKEDTVSDEQKIALKTLLRDITNSNQFDSEDIVLKSLKRDEMLKIK
ncbi:haloacid dehalogenase-like hydrolase [Campylobacter fetus]|uniref:haloacid dehalogenase-like hydrolase n=1 Tax=Campylobacter fetus TaxID=196 RepID=UPI00073ADF17|nr:haloacid dehalogenase-like hydrolase [Campylobacter fetus]ALV64775.1 phosphoserine phosphatase family protein [Campylobacter fetus subsp. testudinum Sp3]